MTNYYVRIPEEPVTDRTPVFRNIAISNVTVSGAPVVADIQGLPEMPIAGLRLTGVIGSGKRGLQAFNTTGLELHGVKIDAAEGPAFLIRDSAETDLDRVETDQPRADAPVVRLDRVTGAVIQGSRAWPGTAIFLSTAPGLLKSVTMDANDLSGAKTQSAESATDYWQGIDSPDKGLARR